MTIKNVRFEYDFLPDNGMSFDAALPAHFANAVINLTVEDKRVTVTLAGEYQSIEDARAAVEPFLRAWQISYALWAGAPEFRLEYKSAFFDDTSPTPGTIAMSGHFSVTATATASLHVGRAKYPEFPTDFAATPLVETLWHRYRGYQLKQEPLLSMAYFCLTAVENEAGSRASAASIYRVDLTVLQKIGELTSTRGDASSARKAAAGQKPLTASEHAWLESAVKALILQVGRSAKNPATPLLKITDLPSL